jgi:hypothetical protein
MDYNKFLTDKTRKPKPMGFAPPKHINDVLFDWQIKAVKWALQRGRSALFEECGLGKTGQQLAWAEHVHKHTGEAVIIHCPVGIRQQTKAEAEKFGIEAPVAVVDDGCDTINGINLVNYEKLHKFDTTIFAGVVLDESSILKNFTGKTKRQILAAYESTPYKLACTATPAPNDLMELGNHADFLGVMPSNEMLSRWFINDTMKAGGYRLKQHAAEGPAILAATIRDSIYRRCSLTSILLQSLPMHRKECSLTFPAYPRRPSTKTRGQLAASELHLWRI